MPKHRVPNLPGKTNWVEQAGGLPPAIENVAGAILDDPTSGIKDVSRAVSTAVSRAKVWAAKGNAKYIKAVAQWEKLRAKAHVKKSELPDLVERMSPVTVDDVLAIPVEERRDLIKSLEAEEALEAGPPPATAPRTTLFKALGGGEKFDEKEHPRWPKGTPGIGGKFCPKGMPGPSIRLASQVLSKLNNDNKQHAELAKRFQAEAKSVDWSKESNADAKTRELLQKNIVEPLAGAAPEAKGGKDPWIGGQRGEKTDAAGPGLSDEAKRKRLEGAANATDEDVDHANDVAGKLALEGEGKLNGGYTLERGAGGGWILWNPDGSSDQGSKNDVLDKYREHREKDNLPPEAKKPKLKATATQYGKGGGDFPGLDAEEKKKKDDAKKKESDAKAEAARAKREQAKAEADAKKPVPEPAMTPKGEPVDYNRRSEDDPRYDNAARTRAADLTSSGDPKKDAEWRAGGKPPESDTIRQSIEAGVGFSDEELQAELGDPTNSDADRDWLRNYLEETSGADPAELDRLRAVGGPGEGQLLAPGADVPEEWREMLTNPKLGGWDDADVDDATAQEAFDALQTVDVFPDSMNLKDVTQEVLDAAPSSASRGPNNPSRPGASKTLDLREAKDKLTGAAIGDTVDLGFGITATRTGEDEYTQTFPDGETVDGLTAVDVTQNAEDEATFTGGASVIGGINGPVADMADDTLDTKIDLLRRRRREANFNGDRKAGERAQKDLTEALRERRARKSPEAELPNPGGSHRGPFISGRNKLKAGGAPSDLSPEERIALLASIDEADRMGAVGALKDAADLLRETLSPGRDPQTSRLDEARLREEEDKALADAPAPSEETLLSMSRDDLKLLISRGGAGAAAARAELARRDRALDA